MRREMILIVTPHDYGADVFRITLIAHPMVAEDDILNYTSIEILLRERWRIDKRISVSL